MNQVDLYLKLLIDVLESKNKLLKETLILTNNQTSILQNEQSSIDDFMLIIDQKKKLIDMINENDEGFNSIYLRIKPDLINQINRYKDIILVLKQKVVEIGDLDIAITVQEEKNKLLFSKRIDYMNPAAKGINMNKKAITAYRNNTYNKNGYKGLFPTPKEYN